MLKVIPVLLLVLAAGSVAAASDFDVTWHGAVADDKTLDTAAIQAAIDAAHAAGGGRVVLPVGTFRSGSLFLKAGVELHVAKGATLLGSNDIADYPKHNTRIEGHFEPWRLALINAAQLEQVRITGGGTIDGNGILFWAAFWQRRKENPACTNLEVERPRLLFIDRCRDVAIQGVRLRDSGFWNIHLYRCSDVLIEDVDTITYEAYGLAEDTVRALTQRGQYLDERGGYQGDGETIAVDMDTGMLSGAADPRLPDAAAVGF